jgi:hypothetical protein
MSFRRPLAVCAALSVLVAACGAAAGTPPAGTTLPPVPAVTSAPSAAPSATSPSASPSFVVLIDPTLLAVLPAEVDGRALRESTDNETAAAGSPELAMTAASFAAAEVGDTAGQNLAIASLVLVRPELSADAFFESYRGSFDTSACEAIGGVTSSATEEIGGRTVDTTSCGGGATIYHLRLRDGRLIVSVLELGSRGYGRALVEGAEE